MDRAETQAEKRRVLAAHAPDYPENAAHFVTCDFEKEDFLDRLSSSWFVADAPSLFICEGVTAYLTEVAVRATLRRIAHGCGPRSVVVFDHLGKKMVAGDVRDSRDLESRAFVANLGEPLRFGVDHALPLLFEEGFRRVRSTTFDEICLNFTGTYDRARAFRFQTIVVASREAEVD